MERTKITEIDKTRLTFVFCNRIKELEDLADKNNDIDYKIYEIIDEYKETLKKILNVIDNI